MHGPVVRLSAWGVYTVRFSHSTMSSSRFKGVLQAANGLELFREICTDGQRYICYTGFAESEGLWLIGATNGVDMWRVGLSEQDVKEYSQERGESGYLSDISHTLEAGEVQLLQSHSKLTLCLRGASELLEFNLCELSAAERRAEMRTILFSLWQKLTTVQSSLKDCQKQLADAQKPKIPDQVVFPDISLRSSKAAQRPKKPAGHSLVNPSSKRRKAATGVVFGGEDS